MRFVIGSEKMQAIEKHRALRCFLMQGRDDLPGYAKQSRDQEDLPSAGFQGRQASGAKRAGTTVGITARTTS
jgi:hypothetical protein